MDFAKLARHGLTSFIQCLLLINSVVSRVVAIGTNTIARLHTIKCTNEMGREWLGEGAVKLWSSRSPRFSLPRFAEIRWSRALLYAARGRGYTQLSKIFAFSISRIKKCRRILYNAHLVILSEWDIFVSATLAPLSHKSDLQAPSPKCQRENFNCHSL